MTISKKNLNLGKFKNKIGKTLNKFRKEKIIQRIWDKDSTVWKKEPQYDSLIKNRLGWLELPVSMKDKCDEINSFVDEVRNEGFMFAILLGMGGSSMCTEVFKETFGIKEGYLKLFVLDSTDPETIFNIENSVDIDKTLFIVSSKSGSTIEVDSFFRYFFDKVQLRKGNAGTQFISITDPDTQLENLSKENNFRKIFSNPADIGGRYSALSFFGLVPAALIGIDIKKILNNAEDVMSQCFPTNEINKNPGAILGVIAGEFAKKGRDKLTFILPIKIYSFGYWVEQLISESTGKEGKGVLPVEGEALCKPISYNKDRLFVYMILGKESKDERKIMKGFRKRFPVVSIELKDTYDIGGQFYLWEFATAVMGAVLGINPFDEPNVKESKDNTSNVLGFFDEHKKLPEKIPDAVESNLSLYIDKDLYKKKLPKKTFFKKRKFTGYLDLFFGLREKGDYVALMAYIKNDETNQKLLQSIRELIKNKTKLATTLGYGPRFLHSTGQLHKGGADNGMFIQIVPDDPKDLKIPGKPYSFSVLKQAQAIGDYESLVKHKRRVIKINIGSNIERGLKELFKQIKKLFEIWVEWLSG